MRRMGAVPLRLDHEIGKPHRRRGSRQRQESERRRIPGPDSHAKWMVRQEWNKWNIDAFFPMNYNDFYLEDASWLAPIVKRK